MEKYIGKIFIRQNKGRKNVSGTVYLKVEAYTDVTFRSGTYAIKVSQQ